MHQGPRDSRPFLLPATSPAGARIMTLLELTAAVTRARAADAVIENTAAGLVCAVLLLAIATLAIRLASFL